MTMNKTLATLLLVTSALVAPQSFAQSTDQTAAPPAQPPQQPAEEPVEISAPGADEDVNEIVVTGRNTPNIIENTAEVISVLSAADIARTGEGDIAGALQRVTGLSVVGGRFVYVRGLGERYSLALLNGSPLPSPEPLRRVVPLDLFPTNILASSVVQKTYSANYPGEFGGGVINLTTKSSPDEPFIEYGISIGGNTETTSKLGYTYYGSRSDFTGFDDGTRDVPAPLAAAFATGNPIIAGTNFTRRQVQDITASLVNSRTNLIQRNKNIPPDFGFDVTGGKTFELGDDFALGVIGAFGYKHGWSTKGGLQQLAAGATLNAEGKQILEPNASNYRFLSTENRIVVNALLGLTAEFNDHKLRWTNLFIRDSLKEARIQNGTDESNVGIDLISKNYTSWFERQLVNTQLVGEFDFDPLSLDFRASYARSDRESPYERVNSYRFSTAFNDYFNDLRTNGTGSTVAFSDLVDEVKSASIDLAYKLPFDRDVKLSAGYSFLDNTRNSTRRDFAYRPVNALPGEVTQQRPDFLLSDFNVYNFNILLQETSGNFGAAAYDAGLRVHGVYAQLDAELMDDLSVTIGGRYENGKEFVQPLDLKGASIGGTRIAENYFLPAATITYDVAQNMQIRLAASKTIARPQFRELAPQQYLDSESDRTFFGNPFLSDSRLTNYDIRYEWYFDRDQRLSVAGFAKQIKKPIETIAFQQGGTFFTTFANAPDALLYGAEFELQKYFSLSGLSDSSFFASRRAVVIANYTYSKSKINVGAGDTTIPVTSNGTPVPASQIFTDGTPLTGQSKHLVNLQLGLEDTDKLSQQTILVTYSSNRVTNRGPGGQPDLVEKPGLQIDFVARQGFTLGKAEMELKFEARNLTNQDYEESQTLNGSKIFNNFYQRGRSFSLGLSAKF
jgi:TonB-dependent receptor